jgi:hypothetical protein
MRQILRVLFGFVANRGACRNEVRRNTQKKLRTGIFGVNFAMSKGKNNLPEDRKKNNNK